MDIKRDSGNSSDSSGVIGYYAGKDVLSKEIYKITLKEAACKIIQE